MSIIGDFRVKPDKAEHGREPGDLCDRNGCQGSMELDYEQCTCSVVRAPCWYCSEGIPECDVCGASSEDGE